MSSQIKGINYTLSIFYYLFNLKKKKENTQSRWTLEISKVT